MACAGASCRQGRAPCRDGCGQSLCQHNSDGADPEHASNQPWDWIDDLSYPLDRALLIAVASAIVAIAYRIFN